MQILQSELHKFIHIRGDIDLEKRVFVNEFYWDGKTWPFYIPDKNGVLIPTKMEGLGSGNYFAKSSNREDDINFQFLDTLWQKGVYIGMASKVRALVNAVVKLGVLIAQIVQNYHNRSNIPYSNDFVTAHLEHVLITVRSIFDFIYECIVELLKLNPSRTKKPNLPSKLSKFILTGNEEIDVDATTKKYDLSSQFVKVYAEQAPFFIQIRKLRTKIIHGARQNLPYIYDRPRGYGFNKSEKPFCEIYTIKANQIDGSIVSLIPLLSHIVNKTIGSCDNLISTLFREYSFLPKISPDNNLYSRQPYNYYIKILLDNSENPPIWLDEIISPTELNEKLELYPLS